MLGCIFRKMKKLSESPASFKQEVEEGLTPLQPVAIRHAVVETGSVHTLNGLMAVNYLEHLTDQRAVLLCSILHTHTHKMTEPLCCKCDAML